ncbi:hypothetical protein AWZ03_011891 [Drosophila navojoa]|uniref:RRM domain-containing protein n=1 Tax=Drosophila navojoa TaxID=7232 RepID=A0A484AZ47_DRONA|nr:probable RNA-binding protein CG14230 [Drosophila navojoa]TDG41693.1 hypothetical protein AWZ03_011891 [Drosophila navojoa]
MSGTRFFLADLPSSTTEKDLRGLFQDYGQVQRVELKTKEQFDDSGQTITKVIAFVTLQTDDAEYCLNELNWQRLHGCQLKVSLAKESFLDRLKREREEQQQQQEQPTFSEANQSSSRLLVQNTQNKRRVFGEHEEINDDEVAPELLITKKRAANSIHNGKIVIQQEHDVKPLHIIEQQKKPSTKQLDAKASIADSKRKESLNKMKQQHQQKKSLIQQALASAEAPTSKRIKFSDAEEEEEVEQIKVQKKSKGRDLFDDADGEEQEEEFVLPQHSGKKGERLVEMQSKQSLDPRFRITASFVGEDDDDQEQADEPEHPENPQDNERDWQMGILEQVIGRKIDTATATAAKVAKNKKMLRYDPAKEEHQKMVRVKDKDKENVKQHPKQKNEKEPIEEGGTKPAPVSQSSFYVVTDTLKESLKTRGEGFSLLEMFGSSHEEAVAQRQDQLEKLGHEKILVNKSNKLGLGQVNPFSYDSSDSEDEEQPQAKEKEQSQVAKENEKPGKQKKKKAQIFIESFFIPKNDVRLKEGAKFFKSSTAELENENYDQVKKRLKFLITKKIAKTQKGPVGKIVKKNKNKKRNKF